MFDSASPRAGRRKAAAARHRRPLLAGLGALCAAGALAAPAQAAFPGANGRVVYDSYQRGDNDFPSSYLFSSAPNGSDPWQLLADPSGNRNYFDSSASADGKSLAYSTAENGGEAGFVFRIYRSDLDGTNPARLVPDDDYAIEPAWSPDGKHIVYVSMGTRDFAFRGTGAAAAQRSEYDTLWITNADGSGTPAQLGLEGWDGGNVEEPQWSPDGKWIAFDDRRGVYVVSAQGGAPVQVDQDGATQHAYPNWSPDGKKLVYSSNDDSSTGDIVTRSVVDGVPTGDETTIGSGTYADTPVFSPDGTKVLWVDQPLINVNLRSRPVVKADALGYSWLVVANADGTNATSFITSDPTGDVDEPDWAPVPKAPPSPTPTPTPTPTTTPPPSTGGVAGEHDHRCGSRRNFVIHLRPAHAKIVKARVMLRGHRVAVRRRHGRWIADIDLRTLPKKRFSVSITTWTADGKRHHEVRRYWTCTPALL